MIERFAISVEREGNGWIKVFKVLIISVFMAQVTAETTFAAHPLITDDAGTQGKVGFQIEVNGEVAYDNERVFDAEEKTTGGELATVLSYGIIDNLDIVIGLPYVWEKVKKNGKVDSDENGISDMSLEVKWRFFEKEGLSFALKPNITLPTGDENKGLGNGKISYGIIYITTMDLSSFAFHLNLGYTNNEYKLEEDKDANRKGIWHVSLASEMEVVKDLRVVTNIGIERNPDKTSNTHPAFILGGLIYLISENIAIDSGIKAGLNNPETDLTILLGLTFWF